MISIFAAIALTLFSTASAEPNLQRRGLPGAVYTCTESEFRGACQWTPPSNRCIIQGPAGSGISSIGPDPDGFCILYEKFDCTGKELSIRFPGLGYGIPEFAAFKCFANQQARSADFGVEEKGLDALADPRLAGGVGSKERENNAEEIEEMEKDGFKQGLIGLKKGVYY